MVPSSSAVGFAELAVLDGRVRSVDERALRARSSRSLYRVGAGPLAMGDVIADALSGALSGSVPESVPEGAALGVELSPPPITSFSSGD